MDNQATNELVEVDMVEVDLLDMLRLLWEKLWIIVIAMVLCGSIAFTGAIFTVAPLYTSTAMMYVNNNSVSVGDSTFTFSTGQLSAAKSLLDVYLIILRSRTTLEAAIEEADLPYTYGQLRSFVSAGSVNGTGIFTISATCPDPDDAKLIVDTLVEILPERISDIVEGSSVRLVDSAVRPTSRSSPSYTRYALIGVVVGAVLSCAAIIIQDLMNTTVRDEEYLKQRYNIPLLAVIPDAFDPSKKKYGYKYGYKKGGSYRYKYGYQRYGYYKNNYEKSYEKAQEQNESDNGGEQ